MAASSSCESNLAPTEFDFSSSVESSSGLTVAVERCPLCDGSKRTFYCRTCVQGGLFVHSKGTYPERYKERYCKYDILQKERQAITERFQSVMSEIHEKDKKKSEIEDCKRRIEMLKLTLAAAKNAKMKDKQRLEKAKRENYTRVAKARKHEEKKRRITEYINNIVQSNMQKKQTLCQTVDNLAEERRNHIFTLIRYIFPVDEVKLSSDSDSMAVSTVSALRDASHTSFVRGQWVYTDGSGEAQYRIVEPTLPCSGDYTAYNLWVATSQENGGNPDNTLNHPAHRISAALCYTSQLTSILAHILDVRLPRKQPYSDFCSGEMTERQFKTSVAYLNQNVLFLCFSQKRKDLDKLDPRNTLQNISALLNSTTLGTNSSFEINQKLLVSIEDSIIFQEDDSDTGTMDEESDFTADWEEVPEEISDIYDANVPSRTGYSSTLVSNIQTMSYSGRPPDQSQLTSSGFVSSAATSFMSLFRGGDKR